MPSCLVVESSLEAEWAAINKKLDEKRESYFEPDNKDKRFEIRREFQKLVNDATEKIPDLQKAATEYYREQPNADISVVKLLIGVMIHHAREEETAKAFEVAELLTKNKCDEKYFKTIERATRAGLEGERVLGEISQRYDEAKADDLPRVELETSKGNVVIELYENEAPNTVANFVHLVEEGFYDGLTFHRVIRTPKDKDKEPFVRRVRKKLPDCAPLGRTGRPLYPTLFGWGTSRGNLGRA